MKSAVWAGVALLIVAASATAQTYRWTDAAGVEHFTDNPESIPASSQGRVTTSDDITIRNPKIQEEVRQQEETARREKEARPRIAPPPDDPPPPQPAEVKRSAPPSDELPPGRTKSQRIRDNIERRKAEEEKERQQPRSTGF